MLNIIHGKDSAIIVLHEIYGINPYIKWVCEHYLAAGYDILCPNFVKSRDYFDYSREEEAHQYFVKHIGFPSMVHEVKTILMKARTDYKNVFLLGFSVGATAAWICSGTENAADGVICYYGSRIRDYQYITPKCPILLIFAKEEKSFNVTELTCALGQRQFVNVHVLNGKHGFSDPFSKHFNEQSQQIAQNLVDNFQLKSKCSLLLLTTGHKQFICRRRCELKMEDRIIFTLKHVLDKRSKKINMESRLCEDLKVDSLDLLMILSDLEDEFSISLDESDFKDVVTVNDIAIKLRAKGL